MSQQLIDFGEEELLEMEASVEVAPDVVQAKPAKAKGSRKQETGISSSEGEPEKLGANVDAIPEENSGESHPAGTESGHIQQHAVQSKDDKPAKESWHTDIIGTPTGKPNPYFRGVIGHSALTDSQHLILFEDVESINKHVYVDDIFTENPTVLKEIYRVTGNFPEVVVRITKDVFDQLAAGTPFIKKKLVVLYTYTSDHAIPRRTISLNHSSWPTAKELVNFYESVDVKQRTSPSDKKIAEKIVNDTAIDKDEHPETIPPEEIAAE